MTLWRLMYQVHRFMRDGTAIADRKCRIYSEEGMAKAKAKDWRAYTIDNPDISHVNIKEQREELYRQLNTVNKIDTASMFNLELGEVASQIQKENGGGEHAGSHEAFLTCHGVLLQDGVFSMDVKKRLTTKKRRIRIMKYGGNRKK